MVNLVLKWNVKNQTSKGVTILLFYVFIPIGGYIPIFVDHYFDRL
jgi:hypothetical protein